MNLDLIRIGIMTATVGLAAIAPTATWALTPAAPLKTTQSPAAEPKPANKPGGIELSADQLKKIEAIRLDRNKQIVAVLNPDQRTTVSNVVNDEQKLKTALTSMNLTKEQKDKITAIGKKSATEMIAVLTPDQRKQLQELQQAQPKK